MRLPWLNRLFERPILLLGVVFFVFHALTSYDFYHVNSFKILLLLAGVALLWPGEQLWRKGMVSQGQAKLGLLISLPILAGVPGYFWQGGKQNYNFNYELATGLVLILWALVFYAWVRDETDLRLFLLLAGASLIYVGAWALLERLGLHPLMWGVKLDMPKSTFGHRNYFSGFLILILPLFLSLSLPYPKPPNGLSWQKGQGFYLLALGFGLLSLVLAETRAAMAGGALGFFLVLWLYAYYLGSPRLKKGLILVSLGILLLLAGLAVYFYWNIEVYRHNRFAALFTWQAWAGRLLPWKTAWDSWKASPLVGWGLGSSYNLFFSFVDPSSRLFHNERSYNHAHSEPLEYLQEAGLLGVAMHLLLWVWLVWRLMGFLRRSQKQDFSTRMAMGLAGSLIAYQLHSIFTVAPRMMVLKMMLYLVYALVALLPVLAGQADPPLGGKKPWVVKAGGWACLALALVLYLPWAWDQYLFKKITMIPDRGQRLAQLEAFTEKSNDIYALDYLAGMQLSFRRVEPLAKTLEKTGQIIPHYRNLEFKKALRLAAAGQMIEARGMALKSKQLDRYHDETMDLLWRFALENSDPGLFFEQFADHSKKLLMRKNLVEQVSEEALSIGQGPIEDILVITDQAGRISWVWNSRVISELFSIGRRVLAEGHWVTENKEGVEKRLISLFFAHPWFQLNFDPQLSPEAKSQTEERVKTYFALKEKELYIAKTYYEKKQQLNRVFGAAQAKLEVAKMEEEEAAAKAQVLQEQEELAKQIRRRANWDQFNTRRQMAVELVNRLMGALFPPYLKKG